MRLSRPSKSANCILSHPAKAPRSIRSRVDTFACCDPLKRISGCLTHHTHVTYKSLHFCFCFFFHFFSLPWHSGRLKICLMKKLLVISNSLSGSINAIITISRDRWSYISKDNTSTAEMNEVPKEEKRSHHPSNGEKRLELFSISQRNQQTRIRNQS